MKKRSGPILKGRARDYQRLNEARKAAGDKCFSVLELNTLTSEQLSSLLWDMRVKPESDGGKLFDREEAGEKA